MANMASNMLEKRRFWKNQIKDVSELKLGMIVVKVYSHLKCRTIMKVVTIEKGYFTYISSLEIKNESPPTECWYTDSNLEPYSSGWNPSNYIKKPNKKELKEGRKLK